jgi:N6-L-threonylcarbamoyladenine synthase
VAVTVGPGLVGSLLVGLYYAKALVYVHQVPLAAVNHLEGHILSIFLEKKVPQFPFVAMTVSGGHTNLYHVKGYGQYDLLGQTLDDAAGEAYDKVAKTLGLGYPGGGAIERLAQDGSGDRIAFPRAYLSNDSLNFSFSGLKTAVALYIKKWRESRAGNGPVTVADMAASFQEAVLDVLVRKAMEALHKVSAGELVVAGGVACNKRLRARFLAAGAEAGIRVFFPRPAYCTDNGAMIAVAGYHRILQGETADLSTDARSKYPISVFCR